ncbi:hypothetical protein AB1N83_012741 [Pleurotus pulmonarius]
MPGEQERCGGTRRKVSNRNVNTKPRSAPNRTSRGSNESLNRRLYDDPGVDRNGRCDRPRSCDQCARKESVIATSFLDGVGRVGGRMRAPVEVIMMVVDLRKRTHAFSRYDLNSDPHPTKSSPKQPKPSQKSCQAIYSPPNR